MSAPILQSLLYSVGPVIGMAAAGVAAAWWRPGGGVRSYIQHFAAGVVFAAVGVEILPEVMHCQSPLAAALGFAVGVTTMLAIRASSRHAESETNASASSTPWALIAAVAVDVAVDGMLIGVGSAAGKRQGLLLSVALTGCTVSLGLATASALLRSASPARAASFTAGLGLLPAIGAVGGALLATQLTGAWMEAALSFACAALLYLITEELLVEAHESQKGPETVFTTAVFFVGFLALLLVDMLSQNNGGNSEVRTGLRGFVAQSKAQVADRGGQPR